VPSDQSLSQASSHSHSRFRRWTSFRSARSSSKKDLRAAQRRGRNPALNLPMLNIAAADDDSNVSSHESHLDDNDELEDHLQIEYATEENVLNTGYEERHDLLEENFLTCPLEEVRTRRQSWSPKQEHPQEILTEQETCCANLKKRWMDKYPKLPLSDEMILRFALCAPRGMFHEASAWKKMKRFDRRYLTLTAAGMEKQLLTKVRTRCVPHH
jgi:type II secretory pathway component PulJ